VSHRPTDEPSFDDFKATLRRVQVHAPLVETSEHVKIRECADKLVALPTIDRAALTEALSDQGRISRDMLRTLGLVVGLSHERLTSELAAHLGDQERRDTSRVVEFLDQEFGVAQEVNAARARSYGWPDVLVARAGSRRTAGRAIAGGRSVEDAIEAVVQVLGLPYELRTRFRGRAAEAPCDVAIPTGGATAEIVCAAKGFDSTGSKLTDAVREIEEMANVRAPSQYVLAVVDGIGWHRRRSDLQKIFRLYAGRQIDGLYTLALLDEFRKDVDQAATLRGIPRTGGGAGET
jgi:hypothetical protein